MTLEKLTIAYGRQPTFAVGTVVAMFNPTEIRIARSVSWNRQPVVGTNGGWTTTVADQDFGSIEPATLDIDLFFDTYEQGVDVRTRTDGVDALTRIEAEQHHPPVCRLTWGAAAELFVGVLTSLSQQFTMFRPDGTPVRAQLSCNFVEFETLPQRRRSEPNSSDVPKTRVVRRSDTLQSIAGEEYGDPALWRHIATANPHVGNPRTLAPGTRLTLPRWGG